MNELFRLHFAARNETKANLVHTLFMGHTNFYLGVVNCNHVLKLLYFLENFHIETMSDLIIKNVSKF